MGSKRVLFSADLEQMLYIGDRQNISLFSGTYFLLLLHISVMFIVLSFAIGKVLFAMGAVLFSQR